MRIFILLLFLLPQFLIAQTDAMRIVDQKPVLRKCLNVPNVLEQEQCSNQGILSYIFQNVIYPDSALTQEIEGMVVAEIRIDKFGNVSDHKILKDIGGGCGAEISRVLEELKKVNNLWSPAVKAGQTVDYLMTIPVKFKIPEPAPPALPYNVFGTDTIYHQYSTIPIYGSSIQDMEKLILDDLNFPTGFEDSCSVGTMVAQVVISKEGNLRIVEIIDYDNLGIDFQFKLIELLNLTAGKWHPGTYEEKPVNVLHNIRAVFSPKGNGCQEAASMFASANELARQGEISYADGDLDTALDKWGSAIKLFPNNAEFRLLRGQTLLEKGLNPFQACEDLSIAKMNVTLDAITAASLPLICMQGNRDNQVDSTEVKE